MVQDGGAQGEAAAGEEEEGVLGPAPRGCESPWYVIACVNIFFLFREEFKSDPCCLYSVLKEKEKEERREELAEKWAHEKERGQSPSRERQLLGEGSPSPRRPFEALSPVGQTTSEEAGKKAEQLEDRSPTPTPTDVLMEEEEEEEAKKTGEEKG